MPLFTVCGLHGGAGTTRVAVSLAAAAAADERRPVLLAEATPGGGGLAAVLGRCSPLGLTDLSLGLAGDEPPFVMVAPRLRVLAAGVAERPLPRPDGVAGVLRSALGVHAVVVVDAGTLGCPWATGALELSDGVVWTSGWAAPSPIGELLAGPTGQRAAAARWVLLDTGGRRASSRVLRSRLPGRAALLRAAVPVEPRCGEGVVLGRRLRLALE